MTRDEAKKRSRKEDRKEDIQQPNIPKQTIGDRKTDSDSDKNDHDEMDDSDDDDGELGGGLRSRRGNDDRKKRGRPKGSKKKRGMTPFLSTSLI